MNRYNQTPIPVVLNLVGGTEPDKFHPCINLTLRNG